MADPPAKAPQTAPVPVNEGPLVAPRAAWQTVPPGPPGAAIDPPPCIAPKATALQLEARATRAGETAFPPPMTAAHWNQILSTIPQFKPVMPGPRTAADVVVEPVHLGKPASQPELRRLVDLVKRHSVTESPQPVKE